MRTKGANNSALIVARLLGTEGYSDHAHAEAKRYWRKRIMRIL
jgi:hypothetical protein